MKKLFISLSIISISLSLQAQQDPQYNLYQFNQMIINPAYAGARDGISTVASVRQQWAGFDGAPKTVCASVHSPIMDKKLGVGMTLVNDVMGPRTVTGAYANVAYILKLGQKFKLSFGLNAGYNSYKFNFTKLDFKTTETSSQLLQNQKSGVLDLNSGFYLRSNSFFVGLSVTHMGSKNIYSYEATNGGMFSYRVRTHTFFTIGKSFTLNENVIFAPTIMLRNVNGTGNGDLNLNFFLFKKLWLGVFHRGGYGPGFLMQYYITPKLRVAYSYDTGRNDAKRLGPSHEVMFGFDFIQNKSKIVSPRFL
jgi:type IX secretion system PorP/SprF family membrane protein